MALDRVQLFAPPGGPGVIGGIQAGANVTIAADGTVNAASGTPGVTSVSGSNGVSVTSSTGNVTINAVTSSGQPFSSGTTILVLSSSAPPGYSRLTSQDNFALRVVSGNGGGTGGSVDFTTAFTNITPTGSYTFAGVTVSGTSGSGTISPTGTFSIPGVGLSNTTLTTDQFASHNHIFNLASNEGPPGSFCAREIRADVNLQTDYPSDFSNGSQPHSHPIPNSSAFWALNQVPHTHTWNATSSGSTQTFNGNNLNVQVKYIDAILCSKN